MKTHAKRGGFCSIARDWQAWRSAHSELQVSESRYRALYESNFDGVLLTESDGGILAANPAACRILGRTEQQLRMLTRLDLITPGDPRTTGLIAEREKTGRYQGELEMVRGDGGTFPAEVASAVFATAHGTLTSMIVRDVSERKRTEAQLKERAQWLDIADESIFVTDLDHRIAYWNQGAARMTGWTAAEMIGQDVSHLLEGASVSDPRTEVIRRELADWRGTLSCRHRNGTPQVVAVSVTVLRDARGEPTGRLALCADITEQTRLREKYERALRLQSIGMLASGVAHDFNDILTPIHLSAAMLRERASHRDDLKLLETIQACVTRGAAVTRQILGFAQGVGSEARAIQITPILREVADIVRETFPRSITVDRDSPSELWPVMADPTKIHQVLLNLCVNARDAMPEGGVLRLGGRNCVLDEKAAARIEGARKGAWLELFIEDTGTGIAPDLLSRMWEPFITTKSADAGTGLGLSTVRGIVESHAGFISVDTAEGRGTAFRVFLPAIPSHSLPQEPGVSQKAFGPEGETILVVDDEPVIREITNVTLTKAGYRVAIAANGAEALQLINARPEHFDLILTDIDMPMLNGVQLAAAVAAIRPNLPVAAMSGLISKFAELDPARFSGGFLPKPFTTEELFQAIRNALERKNRETSART